MTNEISQKIKTSKCKPNLFETDDGKDYVNKIFNNFLSQENIKRF